MLQLEHISYSVSDEGSGAEKEIINDVSLDISERFIQLKKKNLVLKN